jgi:hypothetical protein
MVNELGHVYMESISDLSHDRGLSWAYARDISAELLGSSTTEVRALELLESLVPRAPGASHGHDDIPDGTCMTCGNPPSYLCRAHFTRDLRAAERRIAELEGGFLANLAPWDQEANPSARVLGGTCTLLGIEHHVLAVQVEGGLEYGTEQHAVCDPYDRLRDINHLNDCWLEPVNIPGHEGDWVLVIYPFGRG